MDEKPFRAEIRTLHRIIAAAARKAQAQTVLVDKLTAAQIHVELLIKQLRGGVRRRGR